jgi:group I intron endonuclease
MRFTIYMVINLLDYKFYIGQTIFKLTKRFKEHCRENSCIKLYRAIEKHGKENFKIIPIDFGTDQSHANCLEMTYIRVFDAINIGYNITKGGMGSPMLGRKHSAETRAQFSIDRTGKKASEETKQRMSEAQTGRVHSQETRDKLSKSATGRKHSPETINKMLGNHNALGRIVSEETREKISKSQKGKVVSEEGRKNISEAHKIFNDEQEKEITLLYNTMGSFKELATMYNVSAPTISRIIKRQMKEAA